MLVHWLAYSASAAACRSNISAISVASTGGMKAPDRGFLQ
jgi:hypothetical protein